MASSLLNKSFIVTQQQRHQCFPSKTEMPNCLRTLTCSSDSVNDAAGLTQSEAAPAQEAEQQQPPHLLEALLHRRQTAALGQLLPQRQSAGPVHPAGPQHNITGRNCTTAHTHI